MDVVTEARVALLDGFALRLPPGCATADADDLPHGVQRLVACLSQCRRREHQQKRETQRAEERGSSTHSR